MTELIEDHSCDPNSTAAGFVDVLYALSSQLHFEKNV